MLSALGNHDIFWTWDKWLAFSVAQLAAADDRIGKHCMTTWDRRRVVKAALASGAAALWPWQSLFAQSAGALLLAPKQALVIGNSKYKQVPLKNPVNDARGMADALKSAGFGVTLGLELTQAGIRDAIRVYSENLAKTKAVGLFYFAGHGAQLAWRNYLIRSTRILSTSRNCGSAASISTA